MNDLVVWAIMVRDTYKKLAKRYSRIANGILVQFDSIPSTVNGSRL
jgi:hypothetical protein